MKGMKQGFFSTTVALMLACLPVAPAAAHGYGGPCIVGSVIQAVATVATLPLVVVSAAVSALQPQPYSPAPNYYGAPAAGYYNAPAAYGAPPAYPQQPPVYYARPQAYYAPPPRYYTTGPAYNYPMPRVSVPPHGYYAPRPSYSGAYGAPGRYAYRRW